VSPASTASALGATTTSTTLPTSNVPAPNWQVAVSFANSQLGKPYQWGGAGPATYDCSGLTMVAWDNAGVALPHSAQYQYNLTARVAIADLLPGDLVFFGTPTDVHHVGIYVGDGYMIDAPETGEDVMVQSIFELDLLAGGRVS
jgi:cell wall-associated NlpC family hydrolase